MIDRKRVILVFASIFMMMVCMAFTFAGVVGGRLWQASIDNQRVLREVSTRLSIGEDWNEVKYYVDCEILVLGTSRDEIENQLLRVGPYHSRDFAAHSMFVFENYFIRRVLLDYTLYFDDKGLLTTKQRRTGLENVDISCPRSS